MAVRRFNSKSYTLVTAPTLEPVTLAEAKAYVKQDTTDDDAILTMLIASARRSAEEYTKRAFLTQTWTLTMDGFSDYEADTILPPYSIGVPPAVMGSGQEIQLSRQPIQAVTIIQTFDSSNTATTVSAATYTVDSAGGKVMLNSGYSWPTSFRQNAGVAITFTAGWTAANLVPVPIKAAILQYIASMYADRKCSDMPDGVKSILDSFRLPEAYGAW